MPVEYSLIEADDDTEQGDRLLIIGPDSGNLLELLAARTDTRAARLPCHGDAIKVPRPAAGTGGLT